MQARKETTQINYTCLHTSQTTEVGKKDLQNTKITLAQTSTPKIPSNI